MADHDRRSRAQLLAEIEKLRTTIADLNGREFERVRTEQELRRELRLVSENARTTGSILRSTVALTNQATTKLRKAKRRAEEAALAKTRFLANMSHEIRTPMTAILGYTDALMEEGDLERAPTTRIDHLHTLKRNGNHLMRILNDILDLSKIEAGGVDIERVWASPFEIMADIESLMRNEAEARELGLEITCEGPIPARIQTDPTRLRQILMNLVGNAIKFTTTGGVRVVSQLDPEAEDRETMLRITVSDTGCGMAPEASARVFDAFAQADASTTRQFGGTGLGLTISKQLAELLGGDIELESIEEQGSTFTLTVATGPIDGIPMITDPSEQGTAPSLRSDHTGDTRAFLENVKASDPAVRILLVEDGEDNRRLISFTLEKAGFQVSQAENGQAGAELALAARDAGEPFDVILMDMQMPVMDGYDATRRLREAHLEQPIIALTAHAMSGDRERCLEAGCDAFATKPIQRRELVELILDHATGKVSG